MKNLSKYLVGAACVTALAFSTGAFIKVYAAEAPVVAPGQPVDLTYAAEKALPAVVHIKYVQNSKTQTVDVQDDPLEASSIHSVSSATLIKVTEDHANRRFKHQRKRQLVAVLLFHQMDIS